MAAWPPMLPDFAYHHISGSFGEGRSVTPSDSGRVQVRVISGAPPDPISIQMDLTGTEVVELRTFYFVTLEGGSQSFTHVNLFTGAPATYQFKPDAPPPQFDHIISGLRERPRAQWLWRVRFTLLWLS